jgi:hypothetical protein
MSEKETTTDLRKERREEKDGGRKEKIKDV